MLFTAQTVSLLRRRRPAGPLLFAVASCLALGGATRANAYTLNGKAWAGGSNVVMQLGLGDAGRTLADGNTSWNAAVAPALDAWNQQIAAMRFSDVMNSTAPATSGDRINTIAFSPTVFGQAFGSGTLAVTYYITQGSNIIEADVLFNMAQVFDSYRGPLKFQGSGYALADIRRVLLHELGHALGLNHTAGDMVMNPFISDREVLASDDIAGAQSMYGAPAAPAPTPVATPIPLPTAPPAPTPPAQAASSRLVNISTRMRVGLSDEVLIAGFIIKGAQPKKLLLRASGPSLGAAGVKGAMEDPILELHDSTGRIVAQDDDWQTGGQAAEILAVGLAPNNPAEAAVIATLNPGNYTAIVRGVDNGQGIALVEGYELDTPGTRLVNLSTRGRIGVGDEVLIGGLIVQGTAGKSVIIRALGPSLAPAVTGALADPVLELYNNTGALVASNDNWGTSAQRSEIVASTVPPNNPMESAIVTTLAPGNYTAIVHGANGGTGVGLVEVYDLEP